MTKVKEKGKGAQPVKTAKAAKAAKTVEGVAPVTQAEQPTATAEGIPTRKDGTQDKRWRYVPGTRPAKVVGAPPGVTRMARMAGILTGKMTFVREGYDPNGIHSATGARLKRHFVIKNEAGVELMVGRGEMIKYAGITPPSKRVKKEKAVDEVAGAFVGGAAGLDDVEPEAGAGEDDVEPEAGEGEDKPVAEEGEPQAVADLSFLDES